MAEHKQNKRHRALPLPEEILLSRAVQEAVVTQRRHWLHGKHRAYHATEQTLARERFARYIISVVELAD